MFVIMATIVCSSFFNSAVAFLFFFPFRKLIYCQKIIKALYDKINMPAE